MMTSVEKNEKEIKLTLSTISRRQEEKSCSLLQVLSHCFPLKLFHSFILSFLPCYLIPFPSSSFFLSFPAPIILESYFLSRSDYPRKFFSICHNSSSSTLALNPANSIDTWQTYSVWLLLCPQVTKVSKVSSLFHRKWGIWTSMLIDFRDFLAWKQLDLFRWSLNQVEE